MKLNAMLVVPALLGALLLTACGEKPAEEAVAPAESTMEATPAPAAEAAPVPAAAPATEASSGGGYEPTAEERVPGITIDAAAAPAEAAPAEAAAQ